MQSLLALPRDQLIATLISSRHPSPPPPPSPLSLRSSLPGLGVLQEKHTFLGSTSETEASGSTFLNSVCSTDHQEVSANELPPFDTCVCSTRNDLQFGVVGNRQKRRRTSEPAIGIEGPEHSRPPSLSNHKAYVANQDVATTDTVFASQSDILSQRAPTLTNYTADNGTIVYDSLDQGVATTDMMLATPSDIFSFNGTTAQRALTLSNSTADGAMAYDALGQDMATMGWII